ncbi:MAG: hypothetical protein ACM33T_08840 [Solirubrobacterales bacterium]
MGQFTPLALKVAQEASPATHAATADAPADAGAAQRRDLLQRRLAAARAAAGAAGTAGVGGSAEAILAGLRERNDLDLAGDQRARLLRARPRGQGSTAASAFEDLGSGLEAFRSMID